MFFSFEISYVFLKIILVNIFFYADAADLAYTRLQRMNASCFPHDFCPQYYCPIEVVNIPSGQERQRKCDCDPLCAMYDTCCINSHYHQSKPTYKSVTPLISCYTPVESSRSYFMISKCDLKWNGSSLIKSMCEDNSENFQDQVGSVPVTDSKYQLTYKNYFCAVCNNNSDNVTFWDIQFGVEGINVDFPGKSVDDILEELVFDNVTERWTIPLLDAENETELFPIKFNHKVPTSLYYNVRKCTPSVISECAADWTNDLTERQCKYYMGKASFKHLPYEVYRNVHCALCNHVDITQISCYTSDGDFAAFFPYLLDINFKTGSKVGKVKKCSENELYDPFF